MIEFRTQLQRYVLYKWATLLHSPYEMILALFLALISLNFNPVDLPELLADVVAFFHLHCLGVLPDSKHSEFYQAMLCGKRVQTSSLHALLSQSGLLHLFVVSGLHLSLLSKFLIRVPGHRFFLAILLPAFALASGFNPPVVRALVYKLTEQIAGKWELYWKDELTVWHSATLTLVFFPEWWLSYSFQLSWAALIGISISKKQHPLIQHLSIFLIMAPIISQFQGITPVTIVFTYVGSIAVGSLLFPLMILAIPLPFLVPLTDSAWDLILTILSTFEFELLANPPHSIAPNSNTVKYTLFVYLIFVHLCLYLWRNGPLLRKEHIKRSTG